MRYLDGIKQAPPSASLHVGKRAHEVLSTNNQHKIKTGKDLMIKPFIGALEQIWNNEIDDVDWKSDRETKGAAKDSTINMLREYHKERAPKIKATATERGFILNIPFLTERPIIGYIDYEEQMSIADYKTTGSSPNGQMSAQEHVFNSTQLTLYALAKLIIDKKLPKHVRLDYLVRTQQPKMIPLQGTKTIEDLMRYAYIIARVSESIKSGDFWPNTEAKMHTPKMCGFWALCHQRCQLELTGVKLPKGGKA